MGKFLGPAELAAAVTGLAAEHAVLLDERDVKLCRFRQDGGRFGVEGLSHNVLTLQLGIGTSVTARMDGKAKQVAWRRDAVAIVPAATSMTAEWDGVNDLVGLWLKPSFCARALEIPSFTLAPALALEDRPVAQVVGILAETIERGEPFGRLFRDGLVTSLLAYLWSTRCRTDPHVSGGLSAHKRRRVLDYIEANLIEDIGLAALAAQAELSERHFCTSFRRSVGFSPYRYVVERRLLLARSLLAADGGANVTAVAMRCGFKSSSHFTMAFRRRFGLTPTLFRRGS